MRLEDFPYDFVRWKSGW